MQAHYEAFCLADPYFYDLPGTQDGKQPQSFGVTRRAVPTGWQSDRLGLWLAVRPRNANLPAQGWKVHVSACLDNAEEVLSRVWDYCVDRRIAFKFLSDRTVLLACNAKYAERGDSGKFVTIYPRDERQLQQVCEELSEELAGQPGPYVLSDLRWGAGPLYVRYGGFAERVCAAPTGEVVPAIERPDGTLVPDPRRPVFTPPDWVELPSFLQPHLAARTGSSSQPSGYRIDQALHFSNGGGVYVAQRCENRGAEDAPVVLKEARPHAGLDRHGTDAVTRLNREAEALERLTGIDGIPRLLGRFRWWEHHFIAMERLEGLTVSQWMARHYPLTSGAAGPNEIAAYTRRALRILDRVEQLVRQIHSRGVVYGDLHPGNVLIGTDDRVSLVDFELATLIERPLPAGLGARGFAAPADRTGEQIDQYALAAMRLFLFLPLNAVLALGPSKLPQYLTDIEERFPLPTGFTALVARELGPAPLSAAGQPESLGGGAPPGCRPALSRRGRAASFRRDWAAARDSAAEAILLSATPARRERLFPGDVQQFVVDGMGLAYGAAGVLHALDAVGVGRFPEHEQWLLDAVSDRPPRRAGLYDGLAGVTWLLQRLGHHQAATTQLGRLLDALAQVRDISLFGGLAGIGIALLDLSARRAEPQLAEHATVLGSRLAETLHAQPVRAPRIRSGLMRGWSGPAMLFLALHQHTGQECWLDRAEQAVGHDLARCIPAPDGSLQVDDGGRRRLPYLGAGSAGIAMTLAQLGAVRPGAPAVATLPDLLRACEAELVIQPGLLAGRAGLIVALTAMRSTRPVGLDQGRIERALDRHLDRLDWHAVRYRERLAFPGDQLLRLSMDLATGSAGVLLAVSAAMDQRRDTDPDRMLGTELLPGAIAAPALAPATSAAAP